MSTFTRRKPAQKPAHKGCTPHKFELTGFTHYGDGRLHEDFIGYGSDIPQWTDEQIEKMRVQFEKNWGGWVNPHSKPEQPQEEPGKFKWRPGFGRRR